MGVLVSPTSVVSVCWQAVFQHGYEKHNGVPACSYSSMGYLFLVMFSGKEFEPGECLRQRGG